MLNITAIRHKRALKAMGNTLNDNATLTDNLVAACEATLNTKADSTADLAPYGVMSLKQAYDIMQILTHGTACVTLAPASEQKPVSRLAIVKVLRLVYAAGYTYGRASKC